MTDSLILRQKSSRCLCGIISMFFIWVSLKPNSWRQRYGDCFRPGLHWSVCDSWLLFDVANFHPRESHQETSWHMVYIKSCCRYARFTACTFRAIALFKSPNLDLPFWFFATLLRKIPPGTYQSCWKKVLVSIILRSENHQCSRFMFEEDQWWQWITIVNVGF